MFLKSLKLKGILSFRDTELELRPLNVLIGPNGSGKSNLIEVIGLLQALPQHEGLRGITSKGAGVVEWLWAGEAAGDRVALIEGTFKPLGSQAPLQYELGFKARNDVVDGEDEVVADIVHERLHYQGPTQGQKSLLIVMSSRISQWQTRPRCCSTCVAAISTLQ